MTLTGKDKEFRHPGVSRLDYKTLDLDRVLTAFLARLWHQGRPSRIRRAGELSVDDFVSLVTDHPESFAGFDEDTTARWMSTHLLDLVNRGKANEAVAGPRPLHGFTYRFRNSRRSRPYGADEQLYEMLAATGGGYALKELQSFFFSDVDRQTGRIVPGPDTDVETQALFHLVTAVSGQVEDRPDDSKKRIPYPQLCAEPARLLADDVMKLLYHRRHMPRTVLVDYLKVLFAFHLGLYHLRMMKLLPAAVEQGRVEPGCAAGHVGTHHGHPCPHQVHLFVDVDGVPASPAAALAQRSAGLWYRRIPAFIQATYTVRKLDEFADYLVTKKKKLSYPAGRAHFSVAEVLPLLGKVQKLERDAYFTSRLAAVLEADEDLPGEVQQIVSLRLDDFQTYIETLMHYRGAYHRGFVVDSLDSMLLKNRPGALLAQPRGTRGERRFVLDSRLLEMLLQISLLRRGPDGNHHTAPLRVDEFLDLLRERYGIHIDRLPHGDGFSGAELADQAALRSNFAAFLHRLREIGYYQDMSDAYLTQTITPRYVIGSSAPSEVSR
ncbi:hypothetical protein OG890_33790 [Streptomyces anulatus]|uniref:methylation-associated defense system protein MAD7 n=1 Tax=Streptomyces anulatus TaxID=1892 RepID=UPI00224EE3FD|nr:hypothetical protein [Streptomyces anulatus]MCX4488865.1 hypothetical protein [Streptomyces anulatus]